MRAPQVFCPPVLADPIGRDKPGVACMCESGSVTTAREPLLYCAALLYESIEFSSDGGRRRQMAGMGVGAHGGDPQVGAPKMPRDRARATSAAHASSSSRKVHSSGGGQAVNAERGGGGGGTWDDAAPVGMFRGQGFRRSLRTRHDMWSRTIPRVRTSRLLTQDGITDDVASMVGEFFSLVEATEKVRVAAWGVWLAEPAEPHTTCM